MSSHISRRLGITLLMVSASTHGGAAESTTAEGLSAHEIPQVADWRRYVLNVPGEIARPKSVSVEGEAASVSNPSGLIGNGRTTLTTTAAHSSRIVLDFGVLISGYIELGVRNASAPIRLSYSEARDHLGLDGDASEDPTDFFYRGRTLAAEDDPDGRSDVFAASKSTVTLRSPGLRGSQRYIAITLEAPGTVELDYVRVRQTNYVGQYDGYFISSDETLNRAWYASAYALNLSTVRDLRSKVPGPWVIVDGPKRDRVVYAGDLEMSAQAAYLQGKDYHSIVRDTLNLFACRQYADGTLPVVGMPGQPCPLEKASAARGTPKGYLPTEAAPVRLDTFTAFWIVALEDYVRFTGDVEYARTVMPVARRAIDFFIRRADKDGLWRTENYDGKMAINWHTPDNTGGVDSYDNEGFYRALISLAALERRVASDEAAAHALEARAARVKSALLAKFWDPTAGALLMNLEDPKHDHTADGNAAALRFGLLDREHAGEVIRFLRDRLGTPFGIANTELKDNPYVTRYISPYVEAQAALGFFRYGDGRAALQVIRDSWGHMVQQDPGLPWEEMSVTGTPVVARPGTPLNAGSDAGLAHAWSTAVPALTRGVLGVEPVADGFKTWSISPQPVDLAWAQGSVPTHYGPLSVRWKHDESSFALSVAAPAGTTGSVTIPTLGKARTIAMDGKIVWQNDRPLPGVDASARQDSVELRNIAGSHTFAWAN